MRRCKYLNVLCPLCPTFNHEEGVCFDPSGTPSALSFDFLASLLKVGFSTIQSEYPSIDSSDMFLLLCISHERSTNFQTNTNHSRVSTRTSPLPPNQPKNTVASRSIKEQKLHGAYCVLYCHWSAYY